MSQNSENNKFSRKPVVDELKRVLLFAYDLVVAALLFFPMYVQWAFCIIFLSKKKCVKGKLALVTGGGNGLGKAICLKLASIGCSVAVVDIDKDAAEQTAKEVSLTGNLARAYKVDVANADEIIKLRDELSCTLGAVDILVNNAGIVSVTSLEEDPKKIERLVNVNLLGPLLMTKYFLEQMMNRESGHIVSISSMAGMHPSPQIIQYTATKFGVSGYMAALTKFLRQQKLSEKIKTTCVFPFFIKTNETVTNFLNPNIRFKPLEVDGVAAKIVDAIQREVRVLSIPWYFELVRKCANLMPLKMQEKLFRDRILREYEFAKAEN